MYILDDGMLDIMDDGYDRPEMNISLIIALIVSYSRYPIVPRRLSSFSARPLNSIISILVELISYPTHVPLFSTLVARFSSAKPHSQPSHPCTHSIRHQQHSRVSINTSPSAAAHILPSHHKHKPPPYSTALSNLHKHPPQAQVPQQFSPHYSDFSCGSDSDCDWISHSLVEAGYKFPRARSHCCCCCVVCAVAVGCVGVKKGFRG